MHSRFPSHLTAAASALALVLMTAGISMVTFMMIAPTNPFYVLRLPYLRSTGNSLALAVMMVIFGAYCTGMLVWILLFALHRAGVQRLSGLQTVIKR